MPNDAPGEDEQHTTGKSTNKKHPCPLCDKTFTRPSTLRVHLNTHTGAMPYVCEYPGCGRAFNVKSNMQRHFRSHGHGHGHVGASGPGGYTLVAASSSSSSRTEQPGSFADPGRQSASASAIPLAPPPASPSSRPGLGGLVLVLWDG
ncbi:FAD/NAD(P)-binding domain-containing protein [Mycena chlorophos]|uniref:FAD/NAD(P)-binding domain-containing protein n=1 Tax=Mycena chlorophos TaxID=658473 RepID=A0A8H6STR1_MYCCL|nr:FAD/NAD(P)-binding domain-containing protein [Mycena chlorophos]